MVQHKEILYIEILIAFSKSDYDYDIPLHNLNYENMENRNIVAKDWSSIMSLCETS